MPLLNNPDARLLIEHRQRQTKPPTYVANPYLHSNPRVMEARLEAVLAYLKETTKLGIPAYAPVVYTSTVQKNDVRPPQGWYHYDLSFLKVCQSMTLLMMPGYEESFGVKLETGVANALGIPINEVPWDDLKTLLAPHTVEIIEGYNR